MWSCSCLMGVLSSWTDFSQGYSQISLRFQSCQMERAFISSQRDLLVQRMRTLCYMVISAIAFTLLFNVLVVRQHMRETFSSDQGFLATRASLLILIVLGVGLTLFALLLHPKLVTHVSPVIIEVACIGVMCVTMVTAVLRTPDRLTMMLGWSMDEVFGDKYFSDSQALLMIDSVVTAAHLGFPVRWISMLPLEVTSILLYALLVFAIGGNEPLGSSIFSIIILICLVTASALGKRAAEVRERQHFMDIIKERSLRCEAEFELSQASRREKPRPHDLELESQHRSNAESALSSTSGSRAFNLLSEDDDSNLTEQLTKVSELGDAEHWRIKEREVTLLPGVVLGCGGFGQVVKAIFCGVMVAVKLPHDKLKASDLRKLPALCNELRVLRHVRHPNIAGIHGAIVTPLERRVALVMEFLRGIVLDQFLGSDSEARQGSQPSVLQRYSLMLGVCNALVYLHTRCPHIVHGDIKGSNTMVQMLNGAVHAKVLDFGLSRVLTRHTQPLGGTLAYSAPEVLLQDVKVKCSADIYSFGRLINFIATSIPPLSGMTSKEIIEALKQRRPPPPVWSQDCAFEPGCMALVQTCLQAADRERPSALEVHSVLQGLLPKLGLTSKQRQSLEELYALAPQEGQRDTRAAEGRLLPVLEEPGQPEQEQAQPEQEPSGSALPSGTDTLPDASQVCISL